MKIKLKNVYKRFDDKGDVIKDFNYSDDTTCLAIIGPSGSGKSTLLRIIGGLISPTSGEVIIGENKVEYNEKFLVNYRQSVGFVFQSKGLFPHITGLDNITMPLIHVHDYNKKEAEEIAITLLQRFGLEKHCHKYPHELSGGQKQRIAIARAVAIKPKLLLFDEPTSALDPEYTSEVLDMINELKKDNQNIILVTHEMGFARNACEKILFLDDGRLIESGYSKDIFSKPQTKELKKFLDKVLEWNI